MKKVKLGIIGAGYISQICHLPHVYKHKNVEIVAIAEKNNFLLNKIAKKYKIKNKFLNYKDIVKKKIKIDAVIICLNKFSSSEISNFFLKNKISVFSEKPLAINYKEAKNLLTIAKKNKVKMIVGYMKRYDYGTNLIKKTIKSKKLGKLKQVKYESLMGDSFPKKYKFIKYLKPFIKVSLKKIVDKNIAANKRRDYINFLNTHSHGINLLRFYIGDKFKFNIDQKINKGNTFQLKVNNKIVKFFFRYNTTDPWKERITLDFYNGKITQLFKAPILKNKSSEVTINSFTSNKSKLYSNNSWPFKKQTNQFINSILSNKPNVCEIKNCIYDIRLIEKIFSK